MELRFKIEHALVHNFVLGNILNPGIVEWAPIAIKLCFLYSCILHLFSINLYVGKLKKEYECCLHQSLLQEINKLPNFQNYSAVYTGVLYSEVKWPGREVNHSPSSSAEVKNVWSYTSLPHTPA
jgi:hypothetical protein